MLLALSHEIDYVEWCFGRIIDVVGINSKISELNINSNDILSIIAKTDRDILINLIINYFSKIFKRNIYIHSDKDTMYIDLVGNIIKSKNISKNLDLERNSMFLAMHKNVLENKNVLLPTFKESLYTLQTLNRMKNMKIKQNILCTIGCRGGSKGVKNKNIKDLCGAPLISYTILQALKSNLFSHVVLSTDSEEIAQIGAKYGAEVFFLRDKKLADDNAGKLPAIRDALLKSEKHYNTIFDVNIDLQVTSPLREVDDIIESYNQFIRDDNDILITASPSRKSPYFDLIEKFNINGKEIINLSKRPSTPILRRQDSPQCYDMNGSIYIWKRDVLLNSDSIFVEKTGLYIMPEERSIDIDTEVDFSFAEFMMNKRLTKQL